MRKDRKQTINVSIANIQGYHGGRGNSSNYAFNGFGANKYFTSDRSIPLDRDFRRPDGKALKGIGIEKEIECYGCTESAILAEIFEKIIFTHFPKDLFKMQRDGSLGGNTSVECITQVMTKEFIRNNYSSFKLLYDTYFPAFSLSSTRSGKCGMHVNVSNAVFGTTEKAQIEAIRKLYYIINRHYDVMCEMFNRNRRFTEYCGRMNYANARNLDLYNMSSSHGNCFNGSHFREGRIEIRLVGGQSNFACFRNTMETVFFLCERVKTISWNDCDDLEKIFTGCNQYVLSRISRTRDNIPGSFSAAAYERLDAAKKEDAFI